MGYEDPILRVAERLRTENEEQPSSQSDQVTDQGAFDVWEVKSPKLER